MGRAGERLEDALCAYGAACFGSLGGYAAIAAGSLRCEVARYARCEERRNDGTT
jgi:hypothetical protein